MEDLKPKNPFICIERQRTVGHGDLLVGAPPSCNGVGPEALQWPVLRRLLLGFWRL